MKQKPNNRKRCESGVQFTRSTFSNRIFPLLLSRRSTASLEHRAPGLLSRPTTLSKGHRLSAQGEAGESVLALDKGAREGEKNC